MYTVCTVHLLSMKGFKGFLRYNCNLLHVNRTVQGHAESLKFELLFKTANPQYTKTCVHESHKNKGIEHTDYSNN